MKKLRHALYAVLNASEPDSSDYRIANYLIENIYKMQRFGMGCGGRLLCLQIVGQPLLPADRLCRLFVHEPEYQIRADAHLQAL